MYAQEEPKRTHKHYDRALSKFNPHEHNVVAPVTIGRNPHDSIRIVHGTNSIINNPKKPWKISTEYTKTSTFIQVNIIEIPTQELGSF